MDNGNKKRIQSLKDRILFLLDTSAFQILEEWGLKLGVDLLTKIQESGTHYYFITNEVWVELHQKRFEKQMNSQLDFVLNAETSGFHNMKVTSIPIEVDGEMVVFPINAISRQDFNQVWLSLNHPELTIISNDKKLLKAAAIVLKGRVVDPSAFVKNFLKDHLGDPDLEGLEKILASLKIKKVFN